MENHDSTRIFAKKSLGQHFLMHRQIAERIVFVAEIEKTDTVLEIGPGTGLLTRALLEKAGKVVAVETDGDLIPELEEKFAVEIAEKRLELIKTDVRVFDASILGAPYKLVANIPYYITGEIIRQFLTESHKPSSMTLLVQKEVAVRVARSAKESLLSLSIKVYGTPSYDFTVPKGAFKPAPTIDSAVLSVKNITNPFTSKAEETTFFDVLHAGFAHKRKQLTKNLEQLIPVEETKKLLERHNLSLTIRAEDLPLSFWHELVKVVR